jgi:dihydrofolate reductase
MSSAQRRGLKGMAKLIYHVQSSLDGYINDGDGNFDWARPDEEIHSFVNDLWRPTGTYLLGRRMYEVLRYWDDPPGLDEAPAFIQDFAAIWRDSDKIVYSRSLQSASTARTRIAPPVDPEAVARVKDAASDGELGIGGPTVAAVALRAGLVDELHQTIYPVVVGSGTQWLPRDLRLDLELFMERRFSNGAVHLGYRVKN